MFTGIIEEIGKIQAISTGDKSSKLTIVADKILSDLKYGDSVSTNGVCLTVSDLSGGAFVADVMAQTLRNSTLGSLRVGDAVNLERALRLDTRLGGHIVSGHIDCQGDIVRVYYEDIARWVDIEIPHQYSSYLIPKGSVAIDGISLTVAKLEKNILSVSTIPVTQKDTTLSMKKEGDKVNVEFDILAKYIEKLLLKNDKEEEPKSNIDMNFLRENGFL